MRNTLTTILYLLAIAMIAACSGGYEHGHASDHSETDHSHGADTHSHDNAPATEALYGDNASLPGDADKAEESALLESEAIEADSEEHTHGDSDGPHTHN